MAVISKVLKIYINCDPVTTLLGIYANRAIQHIYKFFKQCLLFTMLEYEKFLEYPMIKELIN